MIYNSEDLILFSLIYADFSNEKFKSPKLKHDILYKIFFKSLKRRKNIFKIQDEELEKLIIESCIKLNKEKPRIKIQDREQKAKSYFLSKIGKDNLKKLSRRINYEKKISNKHNIKYITYLDKNYPENLKELKDPPFVLYYKGKLPSNNELEKSLAVVGTRNPDEIYGREVARRVGEFLSKNNWWNISGLAKGCDEYGHIGSLDGGGKTGAILGQGLATEIYPKENKWLAKKILDKEGFVMSELPPTTPNLSLFYILRNRIQSGMTKGIFVVETPLNGGTIKTIKYSLEQERKTIIWDASDIKSLKNTYEVLGNEYFLMKNIKNSENLSIKTAEKLKKKILKVKKMDEIYKIL